MKNYSNLTRRSRLLLLMLFALLAGGVSPAWADAYTTGFESTDGWATISEMGGTDSKWSSQGYYASDYELSTTYKYQGSKGLYNAQTNSDSYYITPKLAAGTISFWAVGKKETGSSNNYVKVFKCTDNGDGTFTIDSENLSTHSNYNYSGSDYLRCNKNSLTYTEYSFTLDSDSHLAFLISRAGIDNFSASNGLASAVVPNKAVDITAFTTTTPSAAANSENKYNASFSVTVKNDGLQDIVAADNVTVSLLNASDEVIATSDAIEITKAEGSKEVTLNYEGTATTDQTVTFKVKDNFSDKTFATTASVTVTAYGARFAIDKTSANFGLLALNATSTPQTFEITNSGSSDLVITVGETGDAYAYKTLLFSNNKNWSNVYLYAWSSEGALTAAFPGNEQTTTVGTNPEGETLYAITVPKGATQIIVSNGSSGDKNQSANINMDYTKTGLFLDNNYAGVFYGDGDLLVRANSKNILAVGMATTTTGVKSGSIELTYTALNGSSTTISTGGVVMPADADVVDFNTAIPSTWENQDNGWSIFNYEAAKCTGKKNLTTSKLDFSSDENPFFLMMVKASDSGSGDYITVEGSTDNGATWTAFDKKTYSYPTDFGASTGEYSAIVVSIPNTVNKLRFNGYYVLIDQIVGLKYSANDPCMGVYSDAECNTAVADASVMVAKGFVMEAPAAITYYIKNDGTGTMNLEVTDNVTGMTAALGATALTAGQSTTLTLTKDATKGFFGGDAVVTAEGLGTFTVNVTGVLVDENKFDLDFTTADIPATWTATDWTKNNGGFIRAAYKYNGNATLETTTLTATAGEELVVVARSQSSSSSYTVGVNYKKITDTEWSTLIAATNPGTNWAMLHAPIAEAGDYVLQFTGNYADIQRIYGLAKPDAPEMVVYDGEAIAGASYSFGKVTDEADATWTLTVKNEGEAELTGLAVALTGDNAAHYTAVIGDNKTTLAKNETATITVTQLKDNLGAHSATLTISANGLDSKEIALSGTTVDHTILNVDFNTSSEWPAEVLEHGANWTVYNYNGSGESRQGSSSTATSLTLTPLTVASTEDKLTFDVAYYNSSSSRELIVSYTTDGGLTWTDYNWGTEQEPVYDLKQNIGYSYTNQTITGISAGTVVFKFTGKCIKLDNITGDMKVAQAPLMTFTTVEDNISGANLKADATATYTLANNGNADYVGTVALTNVTAEATGDGVTYAENTLTIPAGKTATITVTMAFAAPYGEKTGNLSITSESWVGDISVDYTATLVDPTDFVEDFSGNATPAGWYNEGWTVSGGVAYVYSGTDKKLVTEKLGVATGKNVLSFDAKVYTGSDEQTLKVYTSEDRFNWTAPKSFTLTSEVQHFSLEALTKDSYVLFEAANASIDNLTGVKKLALPDHDLVYVSVSGLKTSFTPGETATATLQIANVLATAEENVHVWAYCRKNGETTYSSSWVTSGPNTIGAGATKGISLSANAPTEEGTYDVMIIVSPTTNESDAIIRMAQNAAFTVSEKRTLEVTDFALLSGSTATADDDNKFTSEFLVTVKNNGTVDQDASKVSVSITDGSGNAYNDNATTWTLASSQTIFLTPGEYSNDGAVLALCSWNTSSEQTWTKFTETSISGFYSAELEGNTNFTIVRLKKSTDDGYDSSNGGLNWNNLYNNSIDYTLTDGNVYTFKDWSGDRQAFTTSTMATLAKGISTTLKVTLTTDAGEGGQFTFKAKENLSSTSYWSSKTVTVTAKPATVAATIGVAGYTTFASAYSLDLDNLSEGLTAYYVKADGVNSDAVKLTKATGKVEPGTGLVLKGNAGSYTIGTAEKTDAGIDGNLMVGCTTDTDVPQNAGYYVLANHEGEAQFQSLADHGLTIPAGKAYLDATSIVNGNARLTIVIDDDTTGIMSILREKGLDGDIYTIEGIRVENPKKGGLYIINGKKVVIK